MQLVRSEKLGYIAALSLLGLILILGSRLDRFRDGTGTTARMALGSRVKSQPRFVEERGYIRYTTSRKPIAFPSAQNTIELCRRFGISQATLLNANGQRHSPTLQSDSRGQVRIPLLDRS